jgi:hypothetical protein
MNGQCLKLPDRDGICRGCLDINLICAVNHGGLSVVASCKIEHREKHEGWWTRACVCECEYICECAPM